MKLDIQGFTKMHKSNQKFSKWKIFDAIENDERYQLCARDRGVHDKGVNAIAIIIYKEPVREVAENVYLIKIAYNEFDNERIRSDKDNTVVYYANIFGNLTYMNVESIINEVEEYTETDYCRIGEYGESECNQTLEMFSVVHYIDGINKTHNT